MKKQEDEKTLLIGIGNSGREDDGLGWAFLEEVEKEAFFRGHCQYRFQLNLEDADLITQYDRVIFVDAFQGQLPDGFSLNRCFPEVGTGFSTHLLSPEVTLYLCQQLYEQIPQAWTLAIQGYQWELKENLSPKAHQNLRQTLVWFKKVVLRKEIKN